MPVFSNCLKSSRSIIESAIDTINSIETLEEGVFTYTASMVPVAMRETSMGTKYIMEYDMLGKLASGQSMTIVEAYEAVCQENGFNSDDAYVLVNGDETDDIKNAVTQESAYLEAKVEDTLSGINSLIAENVNILTSSSNYLAIEEAVGKYKFFKFEKIAIEHPEITKIKDELQTLNDFNNSTDKKIYEEPKEIINVIKKVLRFWYSLNTNVTLAIFWLPPIFLGYWIVAAINKLIVNAIDKDDKKEITNIANDAIKQMETLKKSAKPDTAKKIDEKIEVLKKKLKDMDND
jgi:hypothetical protein